LVDDVARGLQLLSWPSHDEQIKGRFQAPEDDFVSVFPDHPKVGRNGNA